MNYFKNINVIFFGLLTCLFFQSPCAHSKSSSKQLRELGDQIQIINPIATAIFSTQEKGLGHFGIVYVQSMALMGIGQGLGQHYKWKIGERPNHKNGDGPFHSFPSGHTTSAWTSAAYARVFFKDYKLLAIPLYAAAAVTAYSRVESKRHSKAQVLAAIALSEGVVYLNDLIGWSQSYTGFDIHIGDESAMVSFKIKI
jgi:hypothetical protein